MKFIFSSLLMVSMLSGCAQSQADGLDVAKSGVSAGHLRDWPHIKGRAQSPKPNWCA